MLSYFLYDVKQKVTTHHPGFPMSQTADNTPISFSQKILSNLLGSLELTIGCKAIAITSVWIFLAGLKSITDTEVFSMLETGIMLGGFVCIATATWYAGTKTYKKYATTVKRRWVTIASLYAYLLIAIVGMYYTII